MINTYLNQQVSLKVKSSLDDFGKPVLGSPATIEVRFVSGTKRRKNPDGSVYIIDAEMWTLPSQTLNLDDVIVYENTNYKVINVYSPRWANGAIGHKKAELVRTKE